MNRLFLSAFCTAALSLLAVTAFAQHASARSEDSPTLSRTQLEIASRVLTGTAQCEFNQQVSVQAMTGHPGVFKVSFKKASYTMVPQETTTGAVRLEDKKAGIVWLQIPAKSMLLNGKAGQRMVDSCKQSNQHA